MNSKIFSNIKFEILLCILLYISLIIGFVLNENSLGGSIKDYINQKLISIKFSNNFYETLINYDNERTRHSPILIILLSFFEKIKINDYIIRLFNLHFLLLIIIFFYKSLKLKINYLNKKKLLLIALVIFLSPTFRSLSIWPDSRLYGILFFIISIMYFIKFQNSKYYIDQFKNSLFCILFLAVSSYFSPNFFLFYLFFFYYFYQLLKLREVIFILIFSLLIALPAIYYVFILKVYFFLTPVSSATNTILSFNLANKIIIIASIYLFHYLPFLWVTEKNFNYTFRNTFIALCILIISIYFFNYDLIFTGGGIIFKISNILFKNNYALYIFSFFALILLITKSIINLKNLVIFLLLILQNPQLEIYHKYYDPILFILYFTLLDINFKKELLNKKIYIFYIFNIFFLTLSFLR